MGGVRMGDACILLHGIPQADVRMQQLCRFTHSSLPLHPNQGMPKP